MSNFKSPKVIDGFSSVQALRHTGKVSKPRLRSSQSNLPPKAKKASGASKGKAGGGLRIGHTAIPQKHDILCYECSYAFVLTGRLSKTICPKCHKTLLTSDYSTAQKEVLTIQTIGSVHILPGAELEEKSNIVARKIVVAGDIEKALVNCTGTIELCNGAKLDVRKITFKDVLVREDCRISVTRKLECQNIDVKGDIKGNIKVSGRVTIHSGGMLQGKITTPHLIVHDGGGLKAAVKTV